MSVDFFKALDTFAYDVCDTLGRTASMLLAKGVRMEVGQSASTDGREVISLPQAMRRYLAWDEIDFVRYLVHHEHAHIKHSTDKHDVVLSSGAQNAHMFGFVLNILEDIRIEQLEINSGKGVASIYDRGRAISLLMWKEHMESECDDPSVHTMLCHLLFCGCLHPELRADDQVRRHGEAIERLHMNFQLADVYGKVDEIRDNVEKFPKTTDLALLAKLICSLLGTTEPQLPKDMRPSREAEGRDDDGNREASQIELEVRAEDESNKHSIDTWSGGLPEKTAEGLNATGSEEDIKGKSFGHQHGRGLSFGADANCDPPLQESMTNYRWAEWASAMCGQVIDQLRGQERASLSRPKQSGVRVAQSNAVPFLKGLTCDLLRRKSKSPRSDTSVLFCVDDSGSMYGERATNAWRSAGMLAIACERAKIKTLVMRYARLCHVDKLWTQPASVLRTKLAMGLGGGTNADRAITNALNHMRTRREERRVVFFLSDGCTTDCRGFVQEITSEGIEFVPILFGEAAAHTSLRGNCWDVPGTIVIPNPGEVPLGPVLIQRLAANL